MLHGWAPESLLDSYDDERHAAALENLEVTSDTMRFLVPQDEDGAAPPRRPGARRRPIPHARAQVDSGRLAEPFWYVDSPLTTPDDAAARSPAGRRAGECPPPARASSCPTPR